MQPLTRAPEAETAAAARALVDVLTALAKASLEAAMFKGSPVGRDAARFFAELKADKTVTAELRARPLLEKVRVLDQQ